MKKNRICFAALITFASITILNGCGSKNETKETSTQTLGEIVATDQSTQAGNTDIQNEKYTIHFFGTYDKTAPPAYQGKAFDFNIKSMSCEENSSYIDINSMPQIATIWIEKLNLGNNFSDYDSYEYVYIGTIDDLSNIGYDNLLYINGMKNINGQDTWTELYDYTDFNIFTYGTDEDKYVPDETKKSSKVTEPW